MILVLFFVGFSVVVPIDAIAQASRSQNDALNTFIVVGAFVLFGIISIVIALGRVYVQRSCLQDIPKSYLPITPEDMPHAGSRNLLLKEMDRSQELATFLKKPRERVVHDGLARPEADEYGLPPLLNYEDSVKIITSRLKYQGIFSNLIKLDLNNGDTFADIMSSLFAQTGNFQKEAAEYTALYETIRFSGKEITNKQFMRFMDLSIFFSDSLMTTNILNPKSRGSVGDANVSSFPLTTHQLSPQMVQKLGMDCPDNESVDTTNIAYLRSPESAMETTSVLQHLGTTDTSSTVARKITTESFKRDRLCQYDPTEHEAGHYGPYQSASSDVDSYSSVIRT